MNDRLLWLLCVQILHMGQHRLHLGGVPGIRRLRTGSDSTSPCLMPAGLHSILEPDTGTGCLSFSYMDNLKRQFVLHAFLAKLQAVAEALLVYVVGESKSAGHLLEDWLAVVVSGYH